MTEPNEASKTPGKIAGYMTWGLNTAGQIFTKTGAIKTAKLLIHGSTLTAQLTPLGFGLRVAWWLGSGYVIDRIFKESTGKGKWDNLAEDVQSTADATYAGQRAYAEGWGVKFQDESSRGRNSNSDSGQVPVQYIEFPDYDIYVPRAGDDQSSNNQEDTSTTTNATRNNDDNQTTWERDNGGLDDGRTISYQNGSERGHWEKEYDQDGNETGASRRVTYIKEVDEDGKETGKFIKTTTTTDASGKTTTTQETVEGKDSDGDGVPDHADANPTDKSSWTPNPMNDSGDTSNYDGEHDGLRDFRGDIDHGPDGKKGQGYNGEHDELIGLNPRIDYGPDGKRGQGYNGEHNGLKGFNPRIDWDQDHVDTDEFTGNALTDRLAKINPRAIQEVLGSISIAENGRQAKKMSGTDSEFIFNPQAGVLYHNANGAKKGFGSGGAIAEFEIDQDLSLVSVDFL